MWVRGGLCSGLAVGFRFLFCSVPSFCFVKVPFGFGCAPPGFWDVIWVCCSLAVISNGYYLSSLRAFCLALPVLAAIFLHGLSSPCSSMFLWVGIFVPFYGVVFSPFGLPLGLAAVALWFSHPAPPFTVGRSLFVSHPFRPSALVSSAPVIFYVNNV